MEVWGFHVWGWRPLSLSLSLSHSPPLQMVEEDCIQSLQRLTDAALALDMQRRSHLAALEELCARLPGTLAAAVRASLTATLAAALSTAGPARGLAAPTALVARIRAIRDAAWRTAVASISRKRPPPPVVAVTSARNLAANAGRSAVSTACVHAIDGAPAGGTTSLSLPHARVHAEPADNSDRANEVLLAGASAGAAFSGLEATAGEGGAGPIALEDIPTSTSQAAATGAAGCASPLALPQVSLRSSSQLRGPIQEGASASDETFGTLLGALAGRARAHACAVVETALQGIETRAAEERRAWALLWEEHRLASDAIAACREAHWSGASQPPPCQRGFLC